RLKGPLGQEILLEANDTNTKDDLYAIYPDTRSFDDDVTVFANQVVTGVWTLTVADVANNSNSGEVRDAWLEFDMDLVNLPPNAVVTTPLPANAHQRITLGGTASNDPEQATLTFAWTQTSGTSVILENPDTATPTFVLPQV